MDNVFGIDVSVWDDDNSTPQQIDFVKAVNAGAQFVFIKSSQGIFADQDIIYNWKAAKDAGLPRGAYHFLTWDVKPEDQAKFMAGLLKSDMGEIPPVVDYEWWKTEPAKVSDLLWAFMVQAKTEFGVDPIIYTAPGFWSQYGKTNPAWGNYKLWLANYGVTTPNIPVPWEKWTFWQYSDHNGRGAEFGCESKDLDLNWYNGSWEDFTEEFSISIPKPKPASGPVLIPDSGSTQPQVSETDPVPSSLRLVTKTNLNVRSGPGIDNPYIQVLPAGTVVEVLDIAGNDAWVKTKLGWMCKKLKSSVLMDVV